MKSDMPGRARLGHTSTGQTNKPAPLYVTGLKVDKLRRDGIDVHWRHGIQPLLDHPGPHEGETFMHLTIDSYEAGRHHWPPRMCEEFQKRRGYDLWPYLPALTGRVIEDGPATKRFLWDIRRSLHGRRGDWPLDEPPGLAAPRRRPDVGTDLFMKLCVEQGERVLPSGMRYRMLVLPDHTFHTPAFARKLRELVSIGATVRGPRPQHTPSLKGFPDSENENEVRAIGEEVWGKDEGMAGASNRFGKGRVFTGIPPAIPCRSKRRAPGRDQHARSRSHQLVGQPPDRRRTTARRLRMEWQSARPLAGLAPTRQSAPIGQKNRLFHTETQDCGRSSPAVRPSRPRHPAKREPNPLAVNQHLSWQNSACHAVIQIS